LFSLSAAVGRVESTAAPFVLTAHSQKMADGERPTSGLGQLVEKIQQTTGDG
jgi:hypothetical protein